MGNDNGCQAQRKKNFSQLFEVLNQCTDETTSSFLLKKNYPTRKKSQKIP
jgi:hypothetical protein